MRRVTNIPVGQDPFIPKEKISEVWILYHVSFILVCYGF